MVMLDLLVVQWVKLTYIFFCPRFERNNDGPGLAVDVPRFCERGNVAQTLEVKMGQHPLSILSRWLKIGSITRDVKF
jgi:hypothetical protein